MVAGPIPSPFRSVKVGSNPDTRMTVIIVDESATRVTIGFNVEETEKVITALQEELVKAKSGIIVPNA